MSYSNPQRIQYDLGSVTAITAAATIATIQGPKGKTGRIAEIVARVTTSHVLGTTPTRLRVGYGSGADLEALANWFVPAATAGNQVSASQTAGALKIDAIVAPDTPVLVNTIANAGGSAAGVIEYSLAIDWF